jgi:hypothetical protein
MGRGKVHAEFWWGNLREGDNLKNPGVDGRMILNWNSKKWNGGVDWINQTQNRDR